MLPGADGRLECVERLRQHDLIRSSTGQVIRLVRSKCHPGPHSVVTLQMGDSCLRMTASHRVVVQRGGQHEPAPAKDLRAGEDIVCSLGVSRLSTKPEVSEENVNAFELVFEPNLPIETFPGIPQNCVLTMGSRRKKQRRGRSLTSDLNSVLDIPPTDDGFEDHS